MGQYFRACLVLSGIFLTTCAQAGCPQGQYPFTSCQIEGRTTEVFVCYDDQITTYSYGPIGGSPDLFLSEATTHVDFEPWSGVGKEIAESVTFYNGDYSFEVIGGFERRSTDDETSQESRHYGWLDIVQNGERLSRLECIPETVSYGFGGGIYDIKVAAGFEWDESSRTWRPDPNHPMAQPAQAPILMTGTDRGIVEDCLPAEEFKLFGINLGYHVADLDKLVPPVVGQGITGRGPEFERFIYEGLRVDTFQGAIIEMEATTPFWEMPSGIKVGATRGEVISILGRVPNGDAATSQTISSLACVGDQDASDVWYVVIAFGLDKRVQSISFASLSP